MKADSVSPPVLGVIAVVEQRMPVAADAHPKRYLVVSTLQRLSISSCAPCRSPNAYCEKLHEHDVTLGPERRHLVREEKGTPEQAVPITPAVRPATAPRRNSRRVVAG